MRPQGNHSAFAGVVLVGGQSRRMGRPKATMPVAGEANADRLARLLNEAGADPVVFVGDYIWPELKNGVWIRDRQAGAGPLAGLLGFADAFPSRAAIVLATDLFRFEEPALTWLLAQVETERKNCVWPRFEDRTKGEPLASFYAKAAWQFLDVAWQQGERSVMRSMPAAMLRMPRIPDHLREAFRGQNTPEGF